MKKIGIPILIGLILICCPSFFPIVKGMAEEIKLQLPPMPPTIDELTKGKVKIGDMITKDNVDLVKDYLSLGLYQCVKNGMVLRMGKSSPLEKITPRTYLVATERNKGKAVIDDHGVVRLKDGSEWPGGIPFTEPKTGMEVMGYVRWGHGYDNFRQMQYNYYVNKKGICYKTGSMRIFGYFTDGRLKVPPPGSVPGMENYHLRFLNVFTSPLELKGLGQFNINYDDDAVNYDIGFQYLPAFKRTIRISATTYQDNVGGSDFTFGDPEGLREPFGTWNFKLIEKKNILVTEPIREVQPTLGSDGSSFDLKYEWDQGRKYPRLGWTIAPVYIVEATPKDPGHMYSKKILYVPAPYFATTIPDEIALVDIYDRTGKLWKAYYDYRGHYVVHPKDGENYTSSSGFSMHDLQTGHSSVWPCYILSVDEPMEPEFLSLKKLLELGR